MCNWRGLSYGPSVSLTSVVIYLSITVWFLIDCFVLYKFKHHSLKTIWFHKLQYGGVRHFSIFRVFHISANENCDITDDDKRPYRWQGKFTTLTFRYWRLRTLRILFGGRAPKIEFFSTCVSGSWSVPRTSKKIQVISKSRKIVGINIFIQEIFAVGWNFGPWTKFFFYKNMMVFDQENNGTRTNTMYGTLNLAKTIFSFFASFFWN